MDTILPLIFLLACPLMMLFMMKGMHGGHDRRDNVPHHDDRDRRIAELEHQVAELREQRAPLSGEVHGGRTGQ